MKVDAVGASAAFKALERDARGTTLMVFHDQSYLEHLYGVTGYDDPFASYKIGPTVAINPGNAYLVATKPPHQTMDDIFTAADGERVRVAVHPLGADRASIAGSVVRSRRNLKTETAT